MASGSFSVVDALCDVKSVGNHDGLRQRLGALATECATVLNKIAFYGHLLNGAVDGNSMAVKAQPTMQETNAAPLASTWESMTTEEVRLAREIAMLSEKLRMEEEMFVQAQRELSEAKQSSVLCMVENESDGAGETEHRPPAVMCEIGTMTDDCADTTGDALVETTCERIALLADQKRYREDMLMAIEALLGLHIKEQDYEHTVLEVKMPDSSLVTLTFVHKDESNGDIINSVAVEPAKFKSEVERLGVETFGDIPRLLFELQRL